MFLARISRLKIYFLAKINEKHIELSSPCFTKTFAFKTKATDLLSSQTEVVLLKGEVMLHSGKHGLVQTFQNVAQIQNVHIFFQNKKKVIFLVLTFNTLFLYSFQLNISFQFFWKWVCKSKSVHTSGSCICPWSLKSSVGVAQLQCKKNSSWSQTKIKFHVPYFLLNSSLTCSRRTTFSPIRLISSSSVRWTESVSDDFQNKVPDEATT